MKFDETRGPSSFHLHLDSHLQTKFDFNWEPKVWWRCWCPRHSCKPPFRASARREGIIATGWDPWPRGEGLLIGAGFTGACDETTLARVDPRKCAVRSLGAVNDGRR